MKIGAADPDRHSYSNGKTKNRADRAQCGSLCGKEPLQHLSRGAQGFHQGKVAAAVRDPARQSGEHAYRGGENDQDGGHQKCGAHLAQYIGLRLGYLAYRMHDRCGKGMRDALDDGAHLLRGA